MAFTDIITYNNVTIRKLHSRDGTKIAGYLTGVKQPNGDLADIRNHGANLYSAEQRLNAYTIIDRVNGHEIRKLKSPLRGSGDMGYATFHNETDVAAGPFKRLAEARAHAGFLPAGPTEPGDKGYTLPKSAYAQNQKGYNGNTANSRGK